MINTVKSLHQITKVFLQHAFFVNKLKYTTQYNDQATGWVTRESGFASVVTGCFVSSGYHELLFLR
jgi:hypothetical protein